MTLSLTFHPRHDVGNHSKVNHPFSPSPSVDDEDVPETLQLRGDYETED